ncbi:MAG: integrase arm-type DNA-binding domain-containing protein [Acidobacteriales bacterium]|nr:integrase arm-type DNA-binding domain-containing protein [Terriglobales bacterium]
MGEAHKKYPERALTAVQVRNIKDPGMYADGNCLYLVVDENGAKRWTLRTTIHGKRRDMGLGGLSLVSLAEAREAAVKWRKMARAGGDPLSERRQQLRVIPTFEAAAREDRFFREEKIAMPKPVRQKAKTRRKTPSRRVSRTSLAAATNLPVTLPITGFLRLPAVLALFPVSRAAWYQGIRDGIYPAPRKLALRSVGWKVEAIRELLDKTSDLKDLKRRGPKS